MADVRVCKRCRKLFQGAFSAECCPFCEEVLDDIFYRARDYIYDHPSANMIALANGLDENEDDILYLVRQGRISFTSAEGSGLFCDHCKAPIANGRVCKACQKSVNQQLGQMVEKDTKSAQLAAFAKALKEEQLKGKKTDYINEIAKR